MGSAGVDEEVSGGYCIAENPDWMDGVLGEEF